MVVPLESTTCVQDFAEVNVTLLDVLEKKCRGFLEQGWNNSDRVNTRAIHPHSENIRLGSSYSFDVPAALCVSLK